jgi:hypothetical protein
MSDIPQRFRNINISLLRRFEAASAFPPIADMALDKHDEMMRRVSRHERWEDVDADDRIAIEEAERNRQQDLPL